LKIAIVDLPISRPILASAAGAAGLGGRARRRAEPVAKIANGNPKRARLSHEFEPSAHAGQERVVASFAPP